MRPSATVSLGPALVGAFGAAEFYTPAQIPTAVIRSGLDARFIVLAYAAFLPQAQFDSLQTDTPIRLTYEAARSLLERYKPSWPASASGEAPVSPYVSGGSEP